MRTILQMITCAVITSLGMSATACTSTSSNNDIVTPAGSGTDVTAIDTLGLDPSQQDSIQILEENYVLRAKQHEYQVGDVFAIIGNQHLSTGLECNVDYDKDAFSVKVISRYDHEQDGISCGGDRQTITYNFTCKKPGEYMVKYLEKFQGSDHICIEYPITVKKASQEPQKEYKVGDTFKLKGTRHGSVGINCDLEYDTTAFTVKTSSSYDHPQRKNMCGGDRQTITYKITCQKSGTYTIKMIEDYRGQKSVVEEHSIVVK